VQRLIPLNKRLFAGFGLIVLLLIGSAVVSYLNTQQLHEDSQWVTHTHEVISSLQELLTAAVNAETGQRGYIITGEKKYLEPYESALMVIHDHLDDLQRLTTDNVRQEDRLTDIRSSVENRLALLQKNIARRDEEGFASAQEGILSDQGKKAMDLLRGQIDDMTQEELSLLYLRSQTSRRSLQTAITSGIISAILGGLAVGLLFYFVARNIRDMDRAAEIIHREREQLEITLSSIGDGVIATDPQGRVTMLNSIAVDMTGWTHKDAAGQDLTTVFHIVNESTGQTVENPALRALKEGKIVGLANHTELIARDGSRRAIADSASPIRGLSGDIHGAVLVFRDVSADRKVENALRESEALKTAILDTALDAMITCDHEGRVIEFNPAAERIFGYSRDAALGKELSDLIVPLRMRERHKAGMNRYLETGISSILGMRLELPALRADGTEFPVELAITRIPGAGPAKFTAYLRDISERRQAETELQVSERNFRNLADNISQFAWITDKEGYIFWYNQRWFDYTGTTLEEMQGWGWQAVHHPDHVDRVTQKIKHAFDTGETWEDTFPLRGKDGQYRWFLSRARPIYDEDGQIVRWFGTNTDITELRELEEALMEADKRKDQFLATLGHELRNPLAGILGGVEILESPSHDMEDQLEAQRIIGRQSRFMQRMIDELLDVSRIARGKVTLNRTTLDLTQLLREVLQDCRRELDERGLSINPEIAADSMPMHGDRERLRQVFTNLIHNACKFTESGGTVSVSLAKSNEETCLIQIRDTGIGMSQETLEDIFHPFVQADTSLERGRGGLGLGLAIVKGLVELHGGQVNAESDGLAQGSTFTVELPLSEHAFVESTETTNHTAAAAVGPFSVLVIDDRRDASYPLIKFLENQGHRVLTAFDGPSGVAEALQHAPQIVVCDIGLPGFDGYEVARQLRSSAKFDRSLLIAVTGYGQPQDKHEAHGAGFDCHLVKPVERSQLLQEIENWAARSV